MTEFSPQQALRLYSDDVIGKTCASMRKSKSSETVCGRSTADMRWLNTLGCWTAYRDGHICNNRLTSTGGYLSITTSAKDNKNYSFDLIPKKV
jgi:hypothetical protein